MQRQAVPRLNEKKACPRASRSTFGVTLVKSGFSRNSIPLDAPGNEQEDMTIISNKIKSSGINSFEAFSMPLRTPRTMMKWVIRINTIPKMAGFTGSLENVWK